MAWLKYFKASRQAAISPGEAHASFDPGIRRCTETCKNPEN
jgi:hypothetical protein